MLGKEYIRILKYSSTFLEVLKHLKIKGYYKSNKA